MASADGWRPEWARTPAESTPAPDWRKGRADAPAARPSGRWRIGAAWGAFLLVCAGFIWLSTWVRPPRPGRLVLLGARYETNLLVADNAAGWGGLKRLGDWADRAAPLLSTRGAGVVELRGDIPWESSLEKITEPMLVLAISAQGGRDTQGPYLLPQNTDLRDQPRQRLRMDAVLEQLAGLPASQKKVLILDTVLMPSHAALGMLSNDFARGLAELNEKISAIPNLVVLCSTGLDERSWPAPEWGSTAFGHFLEDGLRGAADIDGDHRIDVHELWEFTRDNCSRWARINRLADQRPMLLPRGAEGERRARNILVSLVDRQSTLADLPPPTPASSELKRAWDKWAGLREMTPSPAVFAPERWQKYQAGVLRVENLLRFGDAEAAQKMQAELDRWDAEMRAARELPAPSLKELWAMASRPTAPTVDEATEKAFEKFWDASNDEEADIVWKDWLKQGAQNPSLMPSRSELARLVLERLAQAPGDFVKAGQRLRLIRDGAAPLPPEAHFALMLSRDMPANPPDAELRTTLPFALGLRRAAERTVLADDPRDYSYAERLDPWIGAGWLEVDRLREYGQDLMLGGSAAEWKQANDYLRRADAGYKFLREDAGHVRSAFAVRDRVWAMLPFYEAWALAKTKADPDLDKAIQAVSTACHKLDEQLAALAPAAPGSLAAEAASLSKAFSAIETAHLKHAQSVAEAPHTTVAESRDAALSAEAVLKVPFADRLGLVGRLAVLSREVLVNGQPMTPPDLAITPAQSAQEHGKRFGNFVLARIGPTWFDRWTRPGAESFTQVEKRLEIFGVEEKWWLSADIAGEQIGQRLRKLADETQRLTTLDPKASRADSRIALQDADRIARLADARTPLPAKVFPSTQFRNWLTAELLDREEKRSWQDHWFDDNPVAEPYYRVVCRSLLLDAKNLVGEIPAWRDSFRNWDQTLAAPGELVLVDVTGRVRDVAGKLTPNPDRFAVLTSETAMQREYRLQTSRESDPTPGGLPVVWEEAFQGIIPISPTERQRVVLAVDPDRTKLEESTPLICRFASPLIAKAEESNALLPTQRTSIVLKGIFRGQQIKLETRLEVQPTADVIIRQLPSPQKASVAVRTRRDTHTKVGSTLGGIAFVLDASGSMRPTDDLYPQKSRYGQALTALQAVLKSLPKDAQVSVWTFGAAVYPEKTVEKAEDSIAQTIPPLAWDPQNPKQLEAVMAKLAYPSVEPWNESPICRTMLKAKADLAGVTGYKTIVAITDGNDNRLDKDPAMKRYKNLKHFLASEFDKGDIAVNILEIPPVSPDEAKARKEMVVVESIQPAGKVYPLSDVNKLIAALEGLLKQRLNYFVEHQGRNVTVDGVPDAGLDVSPAGANYRWIGKGMSPGGHKLRVDAVGRVEKNILLHPGDLLLADLVDGAGGLAFERFLFSSEFPYKRSTENAKHDWKMTVLQNQLGPRKDLEMLVSLEKTVDKRETILEQIRPRDAWIEVEVATDGSATPPLRWSYLAGYPAPAWAVNSPEWPNPGSPQPPKVQMWWNPDEPARAAADLVVSDVIDERDRAAFLPGEPPVTLESVLIEKHFIEVKPGELAPRNCLVVRLRHAAGRPIIARLQGMTPTGSETRLYTKADKTATLFWWADDVDAKSAELRASRIRLISVAAFRDEARRRGYFAELRDLPAPDPADERPRPPIELK